jgi:vitamin B12 transporter
MISRKAGLVVAWSLLAALRAAVAQDAPQSKEKSEGKPKEQDVVITASRLDESPRDVASDVSIITSGDLQKAQQRMVESALREVPAVDVSRSGGLGGLTSVFMRGAASGQTLVLVDGVIVNDPISPDRGFDFANLTTDNVERIEVVRGPQSVLYGSDAMGGVINVLTRHGEGDPHAQMSLEAGSFATYRGSLSVQGASSLISYSLGASHLQSAGISSAASWLGNHERDGYRNDTFSGRFDVRPLSWFDIDVTARGTQSRTDLDNGGGAGQDDPNHVLSTDQWLFRVAPRLRLFDGLWEQTLAFSLTTYDTHDDNPPDAKSADYTFSVFRSRLVMLDWQNSLRLEEAHTFVVGLTFRQENGDTSTASFDPAFGPFISVLENQSAWTRSAYGEYRLHLWQRLTATAGARVDDHEEFGTHGTYRGTLAYVLEETDTKLRTTAGTGFKAPSLFQLFSSFGNPDLKPETSVGWDAGVDQGFAERKVVASVSYFRNEFRELIDFDSATSKYLNVGRAGTSGVEAALKILPIKDLEVRLSYTFTDAKDEETGQELLRRARHKGAARVDYAVTEALHVNASLLYVGARRDLDFSTFPATSVTLPDYALINLAASYKVSEKLSLFLRGDNVLNRRYQEVLGFGTPGVAVYGGASVEF